MTMTGGRRLLAVAAMGAALVITQRMAQAHDETVSTSDVTVAGDTLVWKVDVGTAGLEKALGLPASGPDFSEKDLATLKPRIGAYLGQGLTVTIDGHPAIPRLGALEAK